MADSSKNGVVGRHVIGDWFDVSGLITEREPPEGLGTAGRASGGQVLLPSA